MLFAKMIRGHGFASPVPVRFPLREIVLPG